MKKNFRIITVLGVALITTLSALAQESDMDDRKFRFGLNAAPNLGWFRPNIQEFDKSGLQGKLGFSYGLMMDFRFSENPNYLFSTGISMTNNGGGLNEPWDSLDVTMVNDSTTTTNYFYGSVNRRYNLQYVTIPLLLKMRTNEIGYMTYFAAVGLDVGIRTRAFAKDEYDWVQTVAPPEVRSDINIQKQMQLFRLGMNLQAGGEFNLSGNTNFFAAVSYHNHFTNAFRNIQENRILVPDADGNPELDNGRAVIGKQKKAVTNYVALNLGIFF